MDISSNIPVSPRARTIFKGQGMPCWAQCPRCSGRERAAKGVSSEGRRRGFSVILILDLHPPVYEKSKLPISVKGPRATSVHMERSKT